MDYQQSLKNFNQLKNFARPWAECQMFFFFTSVSEYEVEIYDVNCSAEQSKKIDAYLIELVPYAYLMLDKNGNEILYYDDLNMTIEYDLFSDNLQFLDYKDPVDINLVREQFLQLIYLLENK